MWILLTRLLKKSKSIYVKAEVICAWKESLNEQCLIVHQHQGHSAETEIDV